MEGGGCSGRQATRIRCAHDAAYWMAIFSGFTPDWPTPLLLWICELVLYIRIQNFGDGALWVLLFASFSIYLTSKMWLIQISEMAFWNRSILGS